jgi:hypothetical protein
MESAASFLAPWSNFCIVMGSAAAALTGLMFVVITLIRDVERRNAESGLATFSTPTVAHFSAALFVSAVLIMPWPLLVAATVPLGLAGISGIAYVAYILLRARRMTVYRPDIEDWTFHTILPFAAYGAILAGAVALPSIPVSALFSVAAGIVVLVFIGIHNAWDTVTFLIVRDPPKPPAA